jgi:4-carboxymuconolactone decarboxylase
MRFKFVGLGVVVLASLALAQTSTAPDLNLRGNRFKPLTYNELTPEQKTLVEHVLASERKGLNGPFNIMLRSPEMGDAAQQLGVQLRFHSVLPNRLNELAILITARYWNAQYDWWFHHKAALDAGLSPGSNRRYRRGQAPKVNASGRGDRLQLC